MIWNAVLFDLSHACQPPPRTQEEAQDKAPEEGKAKKFKQIRAHNLSETDPPMSTQLNDSTTVKKSNQSQSSEDPSLAPEQPWQVGRGKINISQICANQ